MPMLAAWKTSTLSAVLLLACLCLFELYLSYKVASSSQHRILEQQGSDDLSDPQIPGVPKIPVRITL